MLQPSQSPEPNPDMTAGTLAAVFIASIPCAIVVIIACCRANGWL